MTSEIATAVSTYLEAVRGTERHVVCPRCEGQGDVIEACVKATGAMVFVCDECEATWFERAAVGSEPWVDFGGFMKSIGLDAAWTHLRISQP